jgi:hypothetical protein
VWCRLRDEHGTTVAESNVWAFVDEVRFKLDNHDLAVTAPNSHRPGDEAELDFGAFVA